MLGVVVNFATVMIGGAVMGIGLAIFADPIIVLFAGSDPEMRHIGAICMWTQCLALPLHSWVCMVNMYCVALGNAKGAMALATARQGSCFLPILHVLAFFFGAYGVASVQAIADLLSLALAFPIIFSMKKKVKAALEAQTALVE